MVAESDAPAPLSGGFNSLDWALKRLLRSKANFGILDGFLGELLRDHIEIVEILESEANTDRAAGLGLKWTPCPGDPHDAARRR